MLDGAPVSLANPGWEARLDLDLAYRGGRTIVERAHHIGPLRVQKALYPESPDYAQLLLIHPPGGIAGGDELTLNVSAGNNAKVQLTTPGAAKWYRSEKASAHLTQHLSAGENSILEWLPQESIYFNGTNAVQRTMIDCRARSRACGWDISVLGRRGSGEGFDKGRIRQQVDIRRQGQLLWRERAVIDGGDELLSAAVGWRGRCVSASFWALGLPYDESLLAACRGITQAGVEPGITWLDTGLLLVRALGDEAEDVRALMVALWATLRPALAGRAAVVPRIWAT